MSRKGSRSCGQAVLASALLLTAGTVSAGSVLGTSGAIRTDRLSRKDLQAWNAIVKIVLADNRDSQPLHPTLRHLWDAIETSGHVVYVEMPPRNSKGGMAGRFTITKVDPEGRAHEGVLVMNRWTIENASTGPNDSLRAGGFIPFKGLGPKERQAELLGHELAHAVWTFAEGERARLVMSLPRENLQVMRRVVDKAPGYDQLGGRVNEIERLSRQLEATAEAAEEAIWKELRAGQQRQRASGNSDQ